MSVLLTQYKNCSVTIPCYIERETDSEREREKEDKEERYQLRQSLLSPSITFYWIDLS